MMPNNVSIEYLFTFTAPMNFASFNYQDFVILTTTDPTLNMINNFTTVYTMIDSTKFKLTLTPKLMILF